MIDNTPDTVKFKKPPRGSYSFKEVPLDDPLVWSLFCRGDTKGVFQLEKQLGQDWARRVKPSNIEELSDLISLIRPGPLESNQADTYVKRKDGEEEIVYIHPVLKDILAPTQGIVNYQEQSLDICRKIAGFNDVEADLARRAIGKKEADEMVKIKKRFLEGAEKIGLVTKEEAEEIFGWIETAQRYSFNKCVTAETYLETKDGLTKKITDIEIGEEIKCPSDDNNTYQYSKVLDKISNGKKHVVEIETEDGYTLQCTLDHKILCEDGLKRPLYEILQQNKRIFVDDSV